MKIMRYLCLTVLIFCFSCNSGNSYKLILLLDNASGLKKNNIVLSKGVEIGSVQSIKLYGKGVLVELSIDPKTQISKESVFSVISTDILGTKAVSIALSKSSNDYYLNLDTIVGQVVAESKLDTILQEVNAMAKELRDTVIKKVYEQKIESK